jgi:hypothetical protein
MGVCATPHASLAKPSHLSVAQPLCVTKYTLLDPMLSGIMQEVSCSLRQTTTSEVGKTLPFTTFTQVHQASFPDTGSSLLCRRQYASTGYTVHDPRFAGCPGLHRAAMFQQHLDIRRCFLCVRRVIVSPSCKGQQSRLRPTTIPHHLPCSVLFILMDDLKR